MVNGPSDTAAPERRERPRAGAEHAPVLGASNLNPFGDLVALQHLSARLARSLKPLFEGLLRRELRSWAEPLVVQRYADYRAERGAGLAAWHPLAIGGARAPALLVLDGGVVLEMLDCFFGGDGHVPSPLPVEFTPAAETMVARVAHAIAAPLEAAWEPLARIAFRPAADANIGAAPGLDGGEAMVVTRIGLACGDATPVFVDLLYPVAALKPFGPALTARIHPREIEVEPQWRNGLARAAMGIPLPVRSVLAEARLPLGRVLELRTGDVIPVDFGPEVPVMVADQRLGTGQVGTANGRAAVRLTALEPINAEDLQ